MPTWARPKAESLRDTLTIGTFPPKIMILRMRHVIALDASGLRALRDLKIACGRAGTRLLLAGLHAQPREAIENSCFLKEFGAENVFRNVNDALKTARSESIP